MDNFNQIEQLLLQIKAKSHAGFAIAFHIRLTSPDYLFQTYPKDWINLYSENGWVMADPIVKWGMSEIGSIRWRDLQGIDDQGIFEKSSAFGMKYGVAIAIESDGSRSVAGFARSDRDFTDSEIESLKADVQTLHDFTASRSGMPDALRSALHNLSVRMTHPSTTSG